MPPPEPTPLPDQLQRLQRVLLQERRQGCQDRLVIGGLTRLVTRWVDETVALIPPSAQARLRQIGALASDYAQLSPTVRAERLAAIADQLSGLTGATPSAAAAPVSPARPAPPARGPAPAAGRSPVAGTIAPLAAPPSAQRPPPPPPVGPAASLQPLPPDAPLTSLPSVGPARLRLLERLELRTVHDLLYHLPTRHEDYSRTPPISGLVYGQLQTVVGRFTQVESSPTRRGSVRMVARLEDNTGSIRCTWFWPAQMARGKRLPIGELVVVSGRVGQFNGQLAFEQPDYEPADAELLNVGRLVPVYRATDGLYQKQLRQLARTALAATATTLADPLPPAIRQAAELPPLHEALSAAHFPPNPEAALAGRRRLAFDELLLVQLGVQRRRREWRRERAPALTTADGPDRLLTAFLAGLAFRLTAAQRRALDEVLADLASGQPMSRLLQGDVGSGKTVVAAAAMLLATAHGYQAAIMAPTEILAEQHARNLTNLYAHLPEAQRPPVVLIKGGLTRRQKTAVAAEIASGAAGVVVGTHAVIQSGIEFAALGLAVVDEQHRFGVAQRATLRAKGQQPHLLVMTATPIPRSLALTIHGDLDVSTIDERPPGRQTIETAFRPASARPRAYEFIRQQVAAGRQAFIICPLVEESEAIEARAATAEYERLQREVFPELPLGLLHGRLKPSDKEAVMARFRDGELAILVATAVVEVGIDVPNATVMLIEGADRFGLAQLHQFRGRVGRGAHRSYCILLADDLSERSSERLQLLAETNDGFVLAEHDLRLRGPGEFFGTRQSGLPALRVAGLGDTRTIELAQRVAGRLIEADPALERPEHALLAERLSRFWATGAGDLS